VLKASVAPNPVSPVSLVPRTVASSAESLKASTSRSPLAVAKPFRQSSPVQHSPPQPPVIQASGASDSIAVAATSNEVRVRTSPLGRSMALVFGLIVVLLAAGTVIATRGKSAQ